MKRWLVTLALLLLPILANAEMPDEFPGQLQHAIDVVSSHLGLPIALYFEHVSADEPMVSRYRDKQCQLVFDPAMYPGLKDSLLKYFTNQEDALEATVAHEATHCVQAMHFFNLPDEAAKVAPRNAKEMTMLEHFVNDSGQTLKASQWREYQADVGAIQWLQDNNKITTLREYLNFREEEAGFDPSHATAKLLEYTLTHIRGARPGERFFDRVLDESDYVFTSVQNQGLADQLTATPKLSASDAYLYLQLHPIKAADQTGLAAKSTAAVLSH